MSELNPPAIEVTDLRRRYRRPRQLRSLLLGRGKTEWTEALNGLSFTVAPGEVLGILGPNGAGKTSMVKILSTLVLPSGGEARIFGHDVVREAPAVLSKIGLVLADERSFYWRLTVRENLLFFATLNDIARVDRLPRVNALLEAVEIGEWGDRAFRDLSAGIRQRVALARAMLGDPPLLLMDEPTNSLDPHAAMHFQTWIRDELVAKRGKTILLVTHDASEAEALCNRIGILRQGRMEFLGTIPEFRAHAGAESGYRLQVTGWNGDAASALADQGLALRATGCVGVDTSEVVLDGEHLELTGVFDLLARHGVRVRCCERNTATFPELIAGVLAPTEKRP